MSDIANAAPAAQSSPASAPQAEPLTVESLENAVENEASGNPPNPEQQAALVKAIKKYKLKVDGKEEEMEFDPSNEQELIKHLQMSKVAQKRMAEAAESKKHSESLKGDVEEFLQLLRTNPEYVLKDPNIGVDLKAFAQKIMDNEAQEEAKSPEQKEREALMQQLEAAQKKLEATEKEKQHQQMERLQNEAAVELERDIMKAVEGAELPKSPYYVKRMADMMLLALNQGIDLSAADVVQVVKKQSMEDMKQILGNLPEDVIEAMLGKDKISSLRKRYLSKVKDASAPVKNVASIGADSQNASSKKDDKVSSKDFFSKLGTF